MPAVSEEKEKETAFHLLWLLLLHGQTLQDDLFCRVPLTVLIIVLIILLLLQPYVCNNYH